MTALIAIALILFMGVALLVLLSGIALYARLIKLRTAVISVRSELDNALKKRYKTSPDPASDSDFILPGDRPGEREDDIADAAFAYNAAVRDYNSAIETFPAYMIANGFGLEKAEFFDGSLS